jgi:sensor histidine kinase YesM
MVFLLLLLLGTSYLFYQKSKRDFEEKKEYAVTICVQSIKEHLDKTEIQLIDLMLSTIDDTDLDSTNDMVRYWAKSRINAFIKNKLSVNEDVDCFFVKKEDSFIVNGYSTRLGSASRNRISKYLKKNEELKAFKTRKSYWRIVNIDEEPFFYLVYNMGGYMVGAFIRVSIFDDSLSLVINQDIENYSYNEKDRDFYTYETEELESFSENIVYKDNKIVNTRIVIKSIIPNSNITFVGNFKIRILKLFLNNTYIMLTGFMLVFMVMLFVLKRIISRYIINPIKILLYGMQHVEQGKFDYHIIEDAGSIEFNELNKSFNRMVKEIVDLRIDQYEQQIKDSERKIKLLRMQIEPHFYLNAIITIRSMTYQDRGEEIRLYLDALSDHIRYMLRVNSSEVKLVEELSHIENYLKMQEIKFPNTVAYYIGCNDKLQMKEIGHLLLFTVIENAFKFAMNLYDTLILLIQCEAVTEEGFQGFRVIVEDSGKGFSKDQIENFRIGNEVEEKQEGKHIGLSNIKKTLELQYGRKDLLRLSNIEPHGARVEIWIPDEKNRMPD